MKSSTSGSEAPRPTGALSLDSTGGLPTPTPEKIPCYATASKRRCSTLVRKFIRTSPVHYKVLLYGPRCT